MTSDEILAIRKNLGLSRKKLAELMQISYETLCRWENGKHSPSKYFQNQLLELSGRVKLQQREEKWVFTNSNLQYMKNIVSRHNRILFGTLYALSDERQNFFLAKICVRPSVHVLNDLMQYSVDQKTSSKRRHGRIVGFFVATDQKIRPADHMVSFMYHGINSHYCVIYNKSSKDITVWKTGTEDDTDKSPIRQLPYLVVK